MPLLNQYDCLINLFIFFICPAHSFDVCRNLTFQLDCFIIRQIVSNPLNFTLFIVNTNFFLGIRRSAKKKELLFLNCLEKKNHRILRLVYLIMFHLIQNFDILTSIRCPIYCDQFL